MKANKIKVMRLISMYSLLFSTACAKSNQTISNTASSNLNENQSNIVAVWAHEPNIRLDEVKMLESDAYWGMPDTTTNEKLGYPQEWDDYSGDYSFGKEAEEIAHMTGNPDYKAVSANGYTSNAISARVGDKYGILDYDGNFLIKPMFKQKKEYIFNGGETYSSPITYATTIGYIVDVFDEKESMMGLLLPDFSKLYVKDIAYGVGGEPGIGYKVDSDGVLKNGFMPDDLVPVSGPIADAHGHRCIVDKIEIDRSGAFPVTKPLGLRIYDENGNAIKDLDEKLAVSFINNFAVVNEKAPYFDSASQDWKSETGKYFIYNATSGENITPEGYDNVLWFEDGYCPVSKDGKWGFIDENGNEVTDFIWDDVSTLYSGKAYVGINGIYGVLNLPESLKAKDKLMIEDIYGDTLPSAEDAVEPEFKEDAEYLIFSEEESIN